MNTLDETEAFRREVRASLRSPEIRGALERWREDRRRDPDERGLYRELGRRALLAPDWPVQYGGRGLGAAEATALYEELVLAGIPDTLHVNSIQIVGRFLLMAGTPAQKARHLPALAAGERFGSVLYTEPESGSDLVSLRTRAVREQAGYRIDGVKVYSLKSDRADLGLCAARTSGPGGSDASGGDRYRGISLFLVDLAAEGVRRSVIPSIAAEQFHRVELHRVQVPADALIGVQDEGWPLLTQALAVERTGLDYALKADRWYRAALRLGRAGPQDVSRFGSAIDAARLLAARLAAADTSGERENVDEPLSAAAKFYASELAQDIATWSAGFGVGADTPESACPTPADAAARVLRAAYLEAPGLTLSAGTSEVMLQVVAGAGTLDPGDDPVQRQLRQLLRKSFAAAGESGPGVHAAPAVETAACPSWPVLVELGAPLFEVPAAVGGLDLGLGATLVVAEELGRAALRGPYLDTALLLDAVVLADARAALGSCGTETAGPAPCAFVDSVAAGSVPTPTAAVLAAASADGPVRDRHRVRQAAYLTGLAEGACHHAVRAARERSQFGRTLIDWQAVAHPLARLLVEVEAVRALVRRAAELCEADGRPARDGLPPAVAAAEALAQAAVTALAAARTAVHVCGVRGMTDAAAVHRHYRLAWSEAVRLGTPADLRHVAGLVRLAHLED